MLHPSYSDLMKKVNEEAESDTPVVNSRYSIVMATAKRARQIIADENADPDDRAKPLSTAVRELDEGELRILPGQEGDDEEILDLTTDASEEVSDPAMAETEQETTAETEVSAEETEENVMAESAERNE